MELIYGGCRASVAARRNAILIVVLPQLHSSGHLPVPVSQSHTRRCHHSKNKSLNHSVISCSSSNYISSSRYADLHLQCPLQLQLVPAGFIQPFLVQRLICFSSPFLFQLFPQRFQFMITLTQLALRASHACLQGHAHTKQLHAYTMCCVR